MWPFKDKEPAQPVEINLTTEEVAQMSAMLGEWQAAKQAEAEALVSRATQEINRRFVDIAYAQQMNRLKAIQAQLETMLPQLAENARAPVEKKVADLDTAMGRLGG